VVAPERLLPLAAVPLEVVALAVVEPLGPAPVRPLVPTSPRTALPCPSPDCPSCPAPGVLAAFEAAGADRGAPVGGAMLRRTMPVAGASSTADRAVASPRTGCRMPDPVPTEADRPSAARNPPAAVIAGVAPAAVAPAIAEADQRGRIEAPGRTAGCSCSER
jgi:hypothetical protein